MSGRARKVVEKVPKSFVKRQGDWSQEGGNNTLIVMGTDRAAPGPASVDEGLGHVDAADGGKGAGTIHAVVGRKQSDPDFTTDAAFLYLSQKTNADDNLKTGNVGKKTSEKPAAVLKSTDVRIVFKEDGGLKLVLDGDDKRFITLDKDKCEIHLGASWVKVTDSKIVIESGNIELGEGAAESVVLGDTYRKAEDQLFTMISSGMVAFATAFTQLSVMPAIGGSPSVPLPNMAAAASAATAFAGAKTAFEMGSPTYLSRKTKTSK